MLHRPREHVLEEESRRAFDSAFPSEWVVRPQSPDYGLDAEVQIFKNQTATHLRFLAQLKSTDSSSKSDNSIKYRFSCRHLLYYIDSTTPVMLAVYDAKRKIFFYKWVQSFFSELTELEKLSLHSQETITLHFEEKLTSERHQQIERELRHLYFATGLRPVTLGPLRIELNINTSSQTAPSTQAPNKETLNRELHQWLSRTKSNQSIILVQHEADVTIEFQLENNKLALNHHGLNQHIELPLPLDINTSFEKNIEDLAFFYKVLISFLASIAGFSGTACSLVSDLITHERKLQSSPGLYFLQPAFASLFARSGHASDALDLAELLLSNGHADAATILATAAPIQGMNFVQAQRYRRFLKSVVDIETFPARKAAAHYNLANSLRNTGHHREAIAHYIQAAKFDEGYFSRSYWWGEFAGCLYMTKRRRLALFYYNAAKSMGETRIPVGALIADVLLHLGKFKEAVEAFDEHIADGNSLSAEFTLKNWLAAFLSSKFGNTRRRINTALRSAQKAYSLPMETQLSALEEALRLDPLCDFAWHNYAHFKSKEDPDNTPAYWLAAAILSPWNIETQVNGFASLQAEKGKGALVLESALLAEIHRINAPALREELRKRALDRSGGDVQEAERNVQSTMELARLSEKMFATQSPDAPFNWRLLSPPTDGNKQ
ncbi:DUF4365 domain-containing protein [Cystobacter ferrugineus]|uniref:DUF4365 domain-containing protein n=1 Tax=Cystobacter ferrugineus TaxID=83449 RepID=UPI0009036F23|nr:DUF4365 domain-containing protein [Cystobacter ferrugineus]